MHDVGLIMTVAAAFTAAWLLGLITQRLGLSPLVGYLLAGVLIGPHTPGFVGDLAIAQQLAEVGVILLMFGVGLHFHLKDLLAVRNIALTGALGQSLCATVVAVPVFAAFGMPATQAAILGMAMAVASTVVLMRMLGDAGTLQSPAGHVAVGWLIVEDLITVLLLVLIPVLGAHAADGAAADGDGAGLSLARTLGLALLKISALVAIVLLAGSRLVPRLMLTVARLRSRELFTLTILVLSVAVAAGSYALFGASMALGAFLAGMVVAQSPVSHQAAAEALPMRDAFAVLFFVSAGMLLDPAFVLAEWPMVAAALGVILLAKPLAALIIVALMGHPSRTAWTVAIGLAQIGEFSFILAALAREHGLMDAAGQNVLVAAAIVSIALNPLLFRAVTRLEAALKQRPVLWRLLNRRAERQADADGAAAAAALGAPAPDPRAPRHAIVIGFGPVGQAVQRSLAADGIPVTVVDLNLDTVLALQQAGIHAIYGDAAHESILLRAGLRDASHLILTLPQATDRMAVVTHARGLNPSLRIFVRARYLRDRADLLRAGATAAVFEEEQAADALARLVQADAAAQRAVPLQAAGRPGA